MPRRARTDELFLGDTYGMLKLLVSADDRTIPACTCSTSATEVVHIGRR